MDQRGGEPPGGMKKAGGGWPWGWIIPLGCLVVVLLSVLLPRHRNTGKPPSADGTSLVKASETIAAGKPRFTRHSAGSGSGLTAKETVANKVTQFAQKRRAIARKMAKQLGIELPAEVKKFFDLAETGRWNELQALNSSLNESRASGTNAALQSLRGPIMETFGVAMIAHDWPAQDLLDYGHAILDSLRPGMVYVGGTDPGRFIPTLLNETGDGDPHVIFTQNALADSSYLDYTRFLYGDQMTALSSDDSQRAFQDYMADAQKRLAHDQQFPDEPKQMLPGEDIQTVEGRVQASGQVAVMLINERLLQSLMNKNPDLSFALEESFPLKSTYPNAATLGPIMELGVPDAAQALTADTAAQSINYWRSTAEQLLDTGGASADVNVLKTYSKMASAQAALFADHQLPAQAEQAFQVAIQIYPSNPDSVLPYVSLLVDQKRFTDAMQVAQNAVNAAPSNKQFLALLQQLRQRGN